jgi:hypothetical protein
LFRPAGEVISEAICRAIGFPEEVVQLIKEGSLSGIQWEGNVLSLSFDETP